MLITSAGQSVEGGIIKKLANQLHLENDYRPRALASDLYEYKTLVIVVGYSYNGLLHKGRQFKQEQKRIKELMVEAEKSNLPVVVFDLDMQIRDYKETWAMVDQILPYTDYFIGRRYDETPKELMEKIERHRLASTFVNEIQDMKIPFNSVFR
nr:DUF6305 family protein [Thalassobacillus pellis]